MGQRATLWNLVARAIIVLPALHSASWAREKTLAAQYSCDFRKSHFDNLSLVASGPGAVNLLKPSGEGVRVTVPAGQAIKTLGFSPRFPIRGDFEIQLECEIRNRTQPKSGFGSGPQVYLSMGSTQDAAASLGRQLRPDGRDVYGIFAAQVVDGKRLPTARLIDVPKTLKTGEVRLQLRRVGENITYCVAEDGGKDLRELATLPVSAADVTFLRLGAAQSDVDSSVSLVIRSIQISADELPQLPSARSRTAQFFRPGYQPPLHQPSFRWLWQAAIAAALLAGLTGWLRVRRRG
jgi:hypothetical protein